MRECDRGYDILEGWVVGAQAGTHVVVGRSRAHSGRRVAHGLTVTGFTTQLSQCLSTMVAV